MTGLPKKCGANLLYEWKRINWPILSLFYYQRREQDKVTLRACRSSVARRLINHCPAATPVSVEDVGRPGPVIVVNTTTSWFLLCSQNSGVGTSWKKEEKNHSATKFSLSHAAAPPVVGRCSNAISLLYCWLEWDLCNLSTYRRSPMMFRPKLNTH